MAKYDPAEMQRLAEKLQAKAVSVMIIYPFNGAVFGAAATYFATSAKVSLLMVVGALAGIAIGFELGRQRALALKSQAQSLLCQLKIEENTRK